MFSLCMPFVCPWKGGGKRRKMREMFGRFGKKHYLCSRRKSTTPENDELEHECKEKRGRAFDSSVRHLLHECFPVPAHAHRGWYDHRTLPFPPRQAPQHSHRRTHVYTVAVNLYPEYDFLHGRCVHLHLFQPYTHPYRKARFFLYRTNLLPRETQSLAPSPPFCSEHS